MSRHDGLRLKFGDSGRDIRELTRTERRNFELIPPWVNALETRLRQNGFQAYLVGGAVRDLLWGTPPHDWDLATNALPDQIEKIFPQSLALGKQFGTITVCDGEHRAEITTFRRDLGYSDGRRPDGVRFENDIRADLIRRDFTINALAYDFHTGTLVDPSGGWRDLRRGILRAVGDPGRRFAEDGLRMFRFYRFLATMDLRPDPATIRAIRPEWAQTLSNERIRDEFGKLLMGKRVRYGLEGLLKSGLLSLFLPELAACFPKQRAARTANLWEHLLLCTETIQPRLHLRLAALFHDIAKPLTQTKDPAGVHFYGHDQKGADLSRDIMERLRFPNRTIATVTTLVRHHMFQLPPESSDAAIRRLIAKVGPDLISDLLELRRADIVATGRVDYATWEFWRDLNLRVASVLEAAPPLGQSQLAINGHDLLAAFQLQPGPLIGRILSFLADSVLERPELNRKEKLLELAAHYLRTHNE